MKRRLLTLFTALSLTLCIVITILLVRSYNSYDDVTYNEFTTDKSWPSPNVPPPVQTLPTNDAYTITHFISVQGKLWITHRREITFSPPIPIRPQSSIPPRIFWSHSALTFIRPPSTASRNVLDSTLKTTSNATTGTIFRLTTKTSLGLTTSDLQIGSYDGTPTVLRERAFVFPIWWLILLTSLPPIFLTSATLRRCCIKPGLCPTCGYDLRATPTRCPECGTVPSHTANHTH